MSTSENVVTGAVKLLNSFDITCYESWPQAVQGLVENLGLVIPGSVTNVIVSNQQPSNSQTNYIWFRQNSAGEFVGIYLYSDGQWTQFFPAPNQIIRMYGNSTQVPSGFILADSSNPNITAEQAAFLQNTWLPDSSQQFYTIFDVTPVAV